MVKNNVTYYYHVNGHGDVVNMTDSTGNIVAQYTYDAYGNILSQSGAMASANPYRYAGYRFDENTGLYYLMARYYDASVGRFITRDSFHGVESDPLSLNQYNYCGGDPVNRVDPSGFKWVRTEKYITRIKPSTMEFAINGMTAVFGLGSKAFKAVLLKFGIKAIKSTILNRAIGFLVPYIINPGRSIANFMNSDGGKYIEVYRVTLYESSQMSLTYSTHYYTK